MQSPLEIAFHKLQSSPALEADIREQVDKLEQHCRNLVSCRVTVEASGGKGLPNHHASVHIQLGLPGRNLDISHDPNRGKDHRAHPDAHSAVHDAFRVAARQVQDLKRDHCASQALESGQMGDPDQILIQTPTA